MDTKTSAIVLRRVNYGEADRILTLLTPEGKISALAKGVRREKSKLAGGIELFSVSRVTLHHSQKSDLALLTSARLDTFYSGILADYSTLEFAYEVLKQASKKSEHVDSPDIFTITEETLAGLNSAGASQLVVAWWHLNLLRATGEFINLHTDSSGTKLSPDKTYIWDPLEATLVESSTGPVSADHIKLLRLLTSVPLATARKVTGTDALLPEVSEIVKTLHT